MGERFSDLIQQGLWCKQGATGLAGFHFYLPDRLFFDNPEKIFQSYFMPQFRGVFRAGLNARPATDTLIMGIIKNTKFSHIFRFQGSGGTADLTGCASGAPACIKPCPAKEKCDKNKHGLTTQNMNGPYVISQKGNLVQGPMGQKVAR